MSEMTSAQEFLEPYYPWRQPVKAVKEGDFWLVEFDVGAVKVEFVGVKIDANTREVRELTRPSMTA